LDYATESEDSLINIFGYYEHDDDGTGHIGPDKSLDKYINKTSNKKKK